MKTGEAAAILSRLGEKGILSKSAFKEINKDITAFLKEHPEKSRGPVDKGKL